jgi:hypothetical protein
MNKLLPILLVVVLSGCAGEVKSPLENCADKKVGLSVQYKSHYDDILTMSKYHFIKKYPRFDDKAMYNSAELNATIYKQSNKLRGLSLKSKLEYEGYESAFKECEYEKSRFPETFKSKWK